MEVSVIEFDGERLVEWSTVKEMLGGLIARSTVWRWMRAGTFPKSKQIGRSKVAWLLGDVKSWMANCKPSVDLDSDSKPWNKK